MGFEEAVRMGVKGLKDYADFVVKENQEKQKQSRANLNSKSEPTHGSKPDHVAAEKLKEQQKRAQEAAKSSIPETTPSSQRPSNVPLFAPVHDQIAHNLSIMKKTIDEGRGDQIDIGFIEILANDIAESAANKSELSASLQELSNRIYQAKEKVFFKPSPEIPSASTEEQRPLMGDAVPLKTLADTYTPGNVKKGLEMLDPLFARRPILGDGHCLFRAIAAFGIGSAKQMSSRERNHSLRLLNQVVRDLDSPALSSIYPKFKKILIDVVQDKLSFEDALKSEKTSNELVQFLRKLACEYTRKHGGAVFSSAVESLGTTKEAYLDEMSSMEEAKQASQLEIQALASALGINIRVLDTVAIGRGEKIYSDHLRFAGRPGQDDLFLIHRPGHFDLGIKKI